MSTDVLRRAAAKIRENAEAACPSPWRLGEHAEFGTYEVWGDDDGWNASAVATTLTRLNPRPAAHAAPDAEHIASWHPDVALAAADLLDTLATAWHNHGAPPPGAIEACALARTYLGEEA